MKYRHALTGRVLEVRDGTTLARLVEADDGWSEEKPQAAKKAASKPKESTDGSGDSAGSRGPARKNPRAKRDDQG